MKMSNMSAGCKGFWKQALHLSMWYTSCDFVQFTQCLHAEYVHFCRYKIITSFLKYEFCKSLCDAADDSIPLSVTHFDFVIMLPFIFFLNNMSCIFQISSNPTYLLHYTVSPSSRVYSPVCLLHSPQHFMFVIPSSPK